MGGWEVTGAECGSKSRELWLWPLESFGTVWAIGPFGAFGRYGMISGGSVVPGVFGCLAVLGCSSAGGLVVAQA